MDADNFVSTARHFGYCYIHRWANEEEYCVKAKNTIGDFVFWEGPSRDANVPVPHKLQKFLVEEALVNKEMREVYA